MADLPSVFDLTPLNPNFSEDPHAILDRLRSECPVRRDEQAGLFLLTRYADVRGVLSDTTMWRGPERAEEAAVLTRAILNQNMEGRTVPSDEDGSGILLMDEPDHMRIREPFAKALYKRVARSKPLVEQVVREWLDKLEGRDQFDAMADFALGVPIDVIARILGVDDSRLEEFRDWSEGVILVLNPFRSPEQTKHCVTSANALSAYMRDLMRRRKAEPRSRAARKRQI